MASSVTAERVRSAAKHLEQDFRRVQSNVNVHTVLFKLVAEEMEREKDDAGVEKLRKALLEVLTGVHRLESQCLALHDVGQTFEMGSEVTDFDQLLDESTKGHLEAAPFDPKTHQFFTQLNEALWSINHAGEPIPGQEQEEVVMVGSQYGLLNHTCPITGKPVEQLENPVRSTACHHIYDGTAIKGYITRPPPRTQNRHAATTRSCPISGCTKTILLQELVCDATLRMEIEEHRQRTRATQRNEYTEVDLDDY